MTPPKKLELNKNENTTYQLKKIIKEKKAVWLGEMTIRADSINLGHSLVWLQFRKEGYRYQTGRGSSQIKNE